MRDHAIEVKALRKTFKVGFGGLKQVEAVRGLDLAVRAGEIYGFLGPNGAGKSTTIKILNRLISATAGEALVFGEPLDHPRARQRVGYLPENPVFYEFLTGRELLHHHAALHGLSRADGRRRAGTLLERVGLARAADLQIRRYSKGMVQRLGIAQALLGAPEVVILDEPMSGLDPIGRREIRELILELKGEGRTVFFSTHIIPDVELVCDRVGIVIAGRMVREGAVSELLTRELTATEIGLAGVLPGDLDGLGEDIEIRQSAMGTSVRVPAGRSTEAVLTQLIARGARIVSLQAERPALEDVFIQEITARADADDRAPRSGHVGELP